ncbi:MAG: iron chelate uptake ABC transporter family permease subunit [Velocimicrobium sp.]
MVLVVILTGSSVISIIDVIKTLLGAGTKQSNIIVFDMRLLRALTAIFVGGALGIIIFGAGVQNSTSAASAVVINNPYIVTICAFIGGSISTVIVLLLSRLKSLSPESLILAGAALSSLFSGGSALLQYFAADVQVAAVVFWTFGDIGRTSKNEILIVALCTIAAFIYFMFNRWGLINLNSDILMKLVGENCKR